MKVNGKTYVWAHTKNERVFFTGSISSKDTEGEWHNFNFFIRFNKEEFPESELIKAKDKQKFELDIEEGFLGVTNKDNLQLYVEKGTLKSVKDKKRGNIDI